MRLTEAFEILNQLYESTEKLLTEEEWTSRTEIIAELVNLGYKYNFDKYSNRQLYSILIKTKAKIEAEKALAELNQVNDEVKDVCDDCGCFLTDSGVCPKCYDGATDIDEGMFDSKPRDSWVPMTKSISYGTQSAQSANIVTIVNDKGRLRAQADDGTNGPGWCAFPNNLRTHIGQQYKVDNLIWNGKNYRVSGNIEPVN